jgi:predicted small integral membrane protein
VTLLVATSVAEEGLDIRQCNVVIRFDLAKTVLAYIQSRGRARKPGSDYILMVERYLCVFFFLYKKKSFQYQHSPAKKNNGFKKILVSVFYLGNLVHFLPVLGLVQCWLLTYKKKKTSSAGVISKCGICL